MLTLLADGSAEAHADRASHRRVATALLHLRRAAVPLVDRALARLRVDDDRLERLVGSLDPTLSLRAVRARVLRVIDETPSARTLVLAPNARWGGHRPGAFVPVTVTIDGQRHTRCYSVASAPSADGLVALTVKRVAGGLVSTWLTTCVQPGDVLEIGAAEGQFLLPDPAPARALFISAGSGITPVMSMLRTLAATSAPTHVAFLHYARSPEDILFREELAALRGPRVDVLLGVEDAPDGWDGLRGRFRPAHLDEVAADFRDRDAFLCGPPPFMEAVTRALDDGGFELRRLKFEAFTSGFDLAARVEGVSVVRFVRSGVTAAATRPRTILEEAFAQGLLPAHGCRMGICGACRCTKLRGVVVDARTHEVSGDGVESIRACVSVARGTVEVDL